MYGKSLWTTKETVVDYFKFLLWNSHALIIKDLLSVSDWLTAMLDCTPNMIYTKNSIFWDITLCGLLIVNRRFGGTYRLHLQG
jgi:hypothetical protein